MATTSRLPAVLDYLVTAFTNAATLGKAPPPGTVTVYDGPGISEAADDLTLWVGINDLTAAPEVTSAATSLLQWQPGLGRQNFTEQITVHCAAQATSGSENASALRGQADGIISAVEDLLAADPSLGGTLTGGTADGLIADREWLQGPVSQGLAVQVMFSITASALTGTP